MAMQTSATTGTDAGVLSDVSRRSFLKWSAAAGGGMVLVGSGARLGLGPAGVWGRAAGAQDSPSALSTVWSSCNVNCGSRCPLRMLVVDGTIVRVLPDDTGDNEMGSQQIRACVRGRSMRQNVYSPDRLKSPMKRVGERGSGEWEEISWEQAFDEIAETVQRLIADYGNESIYLQYGTGTLGGTITKSWPPATTPIARLMNTVGGYLNHYADYSTAQIQGAVEYHYGGWIGSNSFDDAKNANLQVMFGNNPLETRMSGGGETFVTQEVKEDHQVRTIVIDPRYSETALTIADEWVAIRPGTDAALVAGMAHVMITEDLHDQDFLDTYCQGFDDATLPDGIPAGSSYAAYILGEGPDGTAKTPQWAAGICGVPAGTITRLAREIATSGPVHITQGWGPQRHANGENQARAVFTLCAMTGNIGIPGGGTGERESSAGLPMVNLFPTANPVEASIPVFAWTDAVDHGAEMTALNAGVRGVDRLPVPIKMIWQYAGNAMTNQHGDINRTVELLKDDTKCEMIVVIDTRMTVSARYADLLLPDTTNVEQLDLASQGSAGNMQYTILADQVIEPMYNCKTTYEMCTEIARRLGTEEEFTEGRTQEEWVRAIVDASRENIPELPSFEELRELGVWRSPDPPEVGRVSLQEFRADPEANPLNTPSGKIEIFSSTLWEMADTWELPEGDRITATPEYLATWEGIEEARTNVTYPLQCIGHHFKQRTHSSYGQLPWLQEAHPQVVWINPHDARDRSITDNDPVEVFNDRGRIRLPARVTSRIAPGVLSVPQGAWFQPDADGVDTGGSVNTLTSWRQSPIHKGNAQHTILVQVERA